MRATLNANGGKFKLDYRPNSGWMATIAATIGPAGTGKLTLRVALSFVRKPAMILALKSATSRGTLDEACD